MTASWILAWGAFNASAFPPAPDHALYGTVRNQWGEILDGRGARIFIQTANGSGVSALLAISTEPGINYRLSVPMDSGQSQWFDPSESGSLRQKQTFQLRVQIGTTIYLPIEMVQGRHEIGEPAGSTRLDLTLGVDSDGDGLPDAWEQALIDIYGGTLASITPGGDADRNGVSNLTEYLAGTQAFVREEGISLVIQPPNNENTRLQFLSIPGRTYTLQSSSDLTTWIPVTFRVVANGMAGAPQDSYIAIDVRLLQIEVPSQSESSHHLYFRAMLP